MAENKTKPTDSVVADFLDGIEPAERRDDGRTVLALCERVTGEPPVMWGSSIIGFGRERYRHDSGREGDMARLSFSPRKAQLVFYSLVSAPGAEELLGRLGKHSTGKGCLYVKRLEHVDMTVLEALIRAAWTAKT